MVPGERKEGHTRSRKGKKTGPFQKKKRGDMGCAHPTPSVRRMSGKGMPSHVRVLKFGEGVILGGGKKTNMKKKMLTPPDPRGGGKKNDFFPE